VLVPLNTRFKAAEAAYILDRADVKLLFTVTDFLATNYVELLRAVDRPQALREIVVLRGQSANDTTTWGLQRRADQATAEDVATRAKALTGDDLSGCAFTSVRPASRRESDAHALGEHPRVLRVGERRRLAGGRPLPHRQPVLHAFGLRPASSPASSPATIVPRSV
jgi:hypothetical protein